MKGYVKVKKFIENVIEPADSVSFEEKKQWAEELKELHFGKDMIFLAAVIWFALSFWSIVGGAIIVALLFIPLKHSSKTKIKFLEEDIRRKLDAAELAKRLNPEAAVAKETVKPEHFVLVPDLSNVK